VMVLPGRNPVVLAKELATLDRLSDGRLLPAFGLGVANPHEQQAFGVDRKDRAKIFDEALTVMRSCWNDETTTFHGERFDYTELRVLPKPLQKPLEVWLGGIAPSELKRVGRMADGWLPSFITPADVAAARPVIEQVASEYERVVPDDHYGALIPYAHGPLPDALVAGLAARRPDITDPRRLVPQGWDQLLALIDQFVDVGTTKFVVLPIVEPHGPQGWTAELEAAAQRLLPRQT
jgi:probable F420-dependent oxidoreductase